MGRRFTTGVVAASVLLVAGCNTVERLEIRADGSASLSVDVVIERDDPVADWIGTDFDQLSSLASEDINSFVEQLFALENIDDLSPGDVEIEEEEDDRIGLTWTRDAESLDELVAMLGEDDGIPLVLAGMTVEQRGDELSLRTDAIATTSRFWRSLFAFSPDVDVYQPGVLDGAELAFDATQSVETVLPGRVLRHDAHDTDGNTLRWSWTLGERAEPGITATWDPFGDPGFDWWGRDQAIVFGFLAFGLLVLVIAGSLGFIGFTRKLAEEGRRVRSGRWPEK